MKLKIKTGETSFRKNKVTLPSKEIVLMLRRTFLKNTAFSTTGVVLLQDGPKIWYF